MVHAHAIAAFLLLASCASAPSPRPLSVGWAPMGVHDRSVQYALDMYPCKLFVRAPVGSADVIVRQADLPAGHVGAAHKRPSGGYVVEVDLAGMNITESMLAVAHELGHVLGYGHTLDESDIMHPRVTELTGRLFAASVWQEHSPRLLPMPTHKMESELERRFCIGAN